jgi:hypothetical protein
VFTYSMFPHVLLIFLFDIFCTLLKIFSSVDHIIKSCHIIFHFCCFRFSGKVLKFIIFSEENIVIKN